MERNPFQYSPIIETTGTPEENNNENLNEVQKEKSSIPVTSMENYLALVKANDPFEHLAPEYLAAWEKEKKDNDEVIDRIGRKNTFDMYEELVKMGAYEKAGYFPLSLDKNNKQDEEIENYSDDNWASLKEKGYKVDSARVDDEEGEEIGRQYYTLDPKLALKNPELINQINLIIEKYNNKQGQEKYIVEEARELILQEGVERGELAYLGNLTTNDIISMMKDGLPSVRSSKDCFAQVWRFDENKNTIYGPKGTYGLLAKAK